jgi:hypothetical protein
MEWLFELSAAFATIAVGLLFVMKFVLTPAPRARRGTPKAGVKGLNDPRSTTGQPTRPRAAFRAAS